MADKQTKDKTNVKTSTKTVTKSASKPVAKTVTKSTPKTTTKTVTKATPKTVTKAVTKPAPKTATKTVTKTTTKPVVKSVTKPVSTPATKTVTMPATKTTTKSVTKSTPKPVTKSATKPADNKTVAQKVVYTKKTNTQTYPTTRPNSSAATVTKKRSHATKLLALIIIIVFIAAIILSTVLICKSCSQDEAIIPFESPLKKQMENLDRGLVAVNNNWGNTFLSWRLLGMESLENQAFDIYRNGVKVHTTEPHDATQWNDYDNPPLDAVYQVVPVGADPNNATVKKINKAVKTLNTSKGAAGYVDILFDMPPDDIQQTSLSTYKLDDNGEKIPIKDTDPNTGKEEIIGYETDVVKNANGDIVLTDRLDENGNQIKWKYGIDDITCGDLDGDGEYELVVMFYGSTQHSWPGYSSPVIIRGIDVDWSTGENEIMWEINCGRNISAGTHYNPILVYDFDGDGKAEMFMKTAPGVYTADKHNSNVKHYVSEAGKGKYAQFSWDYDTHTGSRTLYNVKDIDNSRYYGDPDWGCWSGPELLTVFNGETGLAMQTIGYEADWNIPPKWTGGRDEGLPRWGDYCGNRSERFLATVAYLDGEHPSAVMTRGLYSYVYLTAYDWDGTNINQLWMSEHNWVGSDGASDVREGIAIGNNVVWYGNDLYNYSDSRPHAIGTLTAHGQGNHSLGATDFDNDGKHEIVYGSAVIDDNGLVLSTTGRGHGDAHHINDFNNDGKIEVYTVHEQGPGIDLIQYDKNNSQGYRDIYWSGNAGWDIGRGMAGNLDDSYALKHNVPSVIYSVMNGSLYSTKDGKELKGYTSKSSGSSVALAPNSNGKGCMDFSLYWDGDLSVELLDIAGVTSGAPFLAKHYLDDVKKGDLNGDVKKAGLKGQTNRIVFSNHLENIIPDVGTNNGTKGVPALTADILGDWREEMLFRLNDLNGDGYCDGIRMYTSCEHTQYRLYTLMHDSQYRCQVSSENVGYNQPPHTSYYIGSLALAKDENGNLLNYLSPNRRFEKLKNDYGALT